MDPEDRIVVRVKQEQDIDYDTLNNSRLNQAASV